MSEKNPPCGWTPDGGKTGTPCGVASEDICACCDMWLCEDHIYCCGEGDDVSDERYCEHCLDSYHDEEIYL